MNYKIVGKKITVILLLFCFVILNNILFIYFFLHCDDWLID